MMKGKLKESLIIKLSGDDLENFKTIIKSLCNPKIGFNNIEITTSQKETLEKINDII